VNLTQAIDRIMDRLPDSPETQEIDEQTRRLECWNRFAANIGPRYETCLLSNFKTLGETQKSVVSELQEYIRDMPARVGAGQGILLYGPKGTGKDHLLAALCRAAIVRHNLYVRWLNGVDFYRELRDRMDSLHREQEIVDRYSHATILYFSDPLPPVGDLTSYQSSALFSVIDRRYRDHKPTWISLNVQDSEEASRRMGASIVDRIKENALTLRCNWESYRKEQK